MTAVSVSLAEFLEQRIAEDEAFWPFATDSVEFIGPRMVDARERARRDCEAKRRVVERQADILSSPDLYDRSAMVNAQEVLESLGAVYVDHPDYRDEWLP